VPGGLKNAVDWASRSTFAGPSVWKDKPVGIVGVGPQDYEGAHGGLLAALALRQSGMALEWKMIDSVKLHISRASEKFTEGGELKQEVPPPVQSLLLMNRRRLCGSPFEI
jgi:NAD(P)H-dependent FMN reductase